MVDEERVAENPKPVPGAGKFLGCGGCVWAVIGLFAALFLIALLLPAVSPCREVARTSQCRCNLKQIGMALEKYHAKYGCFPPAYTVDEQGRRMHSWRALILPLMEYNTDGVEYDFNQPWNSPDNIAFAENTSLYRNFCCPSEFDNNNRKRRDTSYVMPVGPNLFAEGSTPRKREDITDEPDQTIAVGEMSHSGIFWTEPRDLNEAEMSFKIDDPYQIGLRSEHPHGSHVVLCDGTVRRIDEKIDQKLLQALLSINGGEDMKEFNNHN